MSQGKMQVFVPVFSKVGRVAFEEVTPIILLYAVILTFDVLILNFSQRYVDPTSPNLAKT